MTQPNDPTQRKEPLGIFLGFSLLIGMHLLAIGFIFILGYIIGSIYGNYSFVGVWIVGGFGFLFWQLLYVLPMVVWLRRRGYIGMMKGIIAGAVVTALLNGGCSLLMVSSSW